MKSAILVKKFHAYDLDAIQGFVEESFSLFSESGPMFGPGQRVLLKPNLLRAFAPERAVTTHPAVLEAVCRALRDCRVGEIVLSDSPAFGSLEAVAHKAGYGPVLKRHAVRLAPLHNPVPMDSEEGVTHLKISGDIDNYDRIINLPKVKSHVQMTLTLAIKNLFGLVIGKRKPVLHCLVDNDKVRFGRMLVDIARRVSPCLTLIDGIVAMEGNGPASGTPYPLGLLAAGRDMTALDRVLVEILGAPLEQVYTLEAARQKGYGNHALEAIELFGETGLDALRVADFHLSSAPMDISFNPLRVARSFVRHLFEVGVREKWAHRD
ncbi:MAG: DUF362 domain-containing protein [Nitrospinaceae bacterium]|nr:MAG: DUF362 domain-containing protein [Nitrospinaceae bacterium]